jgi:hypothetical protein
MGDISFVSFVVNLVTSGKPVIWKATVVEMEIFFTLVMAIAVAKKLAELLLVLYELKEPVEKLLSLAKNKKRSRKRHSKAY